MTQPTADLSKPHARRVALDSTPAIDLDTVDSTGRAALESRIADTFARHYDARIQHFMPFLLSLKLYTQLGAVAGLRLAAQSTLFLEQYLDGRVEQAVASAYKTPVDRAQIVEIGNLASAAPGSAAILFGVLPVILRQAGLRWVVCTATPQIRSMLAKLEFSTRMICKADAALLGDQQAEWGSYYDSSPNVIVGDVDRAAVCVLRNRDTSRLALELAGQINGVVASLRSGG